jgi:hypothetical protein
LAVHHRHAAIGVWGCALALCLAVFDRQRLAAAQSVTATAGAINGVGGGHYQMEFRADDERTGMVIDRMRQSAETADPRKRPFDLRAIVEISWRSCASMRRREA